MSPDFSQTHRVISSSCSPISCSQFLGCFVSLGLLLGSKGVLFRQILKQECPNDGIATESQESSGSWARTPGHLIQPVSYRLNKSSRRLKSGKQWLSDSPRRGMPYGQDGLEQQFSDWTSVKSSGGLLRSSNAQILLQTEEGPSSLPI